ncbi:flagellar basal-body MS-ring/collar protein FliF [Legionella fairfieldensis]|uniref:flagellar basal-body MS-ring/collar protein FliF n=1 Tax=Legionella fairfieldensis TaxID=45064 RepID=UPI00056071BB|nr:flagellar basal-body MS-ring/collar protein FliF [Legionella fairfieldensis]
MNYFVNSLNWFKTQSKQRQLSLIAGLCLIIILTIVLSFWIFSPAYAVLFNQLDNQDANQILGQLEQAHISYQVRNQGRDILIDKNLVDKTRIKLMGSGIHLTNSVGFELFDKSDFGMSDFSQKINYQRALQGELERTIGSLDEVKHVRVHLVIPENHLFQKENNQPHAAVTLHLTHHLTAQQVRSIQQLIAASIAHMPLTNVIIVDQNGNNLTSDDDDIASNHFSNKKSLERYLNNKVTQMLHRVFAGNEMMVKIDATLNYDEVQRELVKPQHDSIITHEKETRHSTTAKNDKKQINQEITREKSYEFGSEKEHFKRVGGNIERLTISVVVPKHTDQQTIAKIERLVKTVVGFDARRGDSISVEALIAPPILPADVQAPLPLAEAKLSRPAIIITGAGTIGFLLVSLVLRQKRRWKKRQLLLAELSEWLNKHD